ncbi:MAG: glycosyltransferase [Candidatus Giovannonibacteria bacterium]|nr:glycosyltransferase [Candidatus Giovannonibacteria bacterium]
MRIAFCTDIYLPQLSGVADSIQLLSNQLKKRGHAVRIYAPRVGNSSNEADVFRLPSYSIPGSKDGLVLALPTGALKDMKRFRPDIIHTHTFSTLGFLALYASWRLGTPLVSTDHTFPADYLHYLKLDFTFFRFVARKFAAWYYNRCSYVTAPSRNMIDELKAYVLRTPAEVISNPIPLDIFRQLDNRAELKNKYHLNKKTILIFGRIAVEKNLDFALDIFAEVLKKIDAELAIVGDGPYRSAMEEKARKMGLEQSVHFFGILRGEGLVEVINASDLYLITSTSDTQSMTLLQAMACGLPAVGARAGGLPEYILENITGFTVPPTDKRVFIEKVVELLKNGALAEKFGDAAKRNILSFLPENIVKKFERVYNEAVKRYAKS